ncbi:uncharacterized protein LOC131613662, partial [Vicia villosa]|uniref:uncharacterized protein LOC131613662 n=1 Tax=Vicia villosa TaxID=3911 RepID=UPI00273AB63F
MERPEAVEAEKDRKGKAPMNYHLEIRSERKSHVSENYMGKNPMSRTQWRRFQRRKHAERQAVVAARQAANDQIYKKKRYEVKVDSAVKQQIKEFVGKPDFNVSIKVEDVDETTAAEMALHRPTCYFVMNNGSIENQDVFFERSDMAMRGHLEPLLIRAKVEDVAINRCFKCGGEGHRAVDCGKDSVTCFKCGKIGHKANKCGVGSSVTCYNCGEQGHISTKCDKPKKEQAKGKVFALSGAEASTDDRLIQGTCFINGTPLIAIIDTGATHSFISLDCAKRLNLVLSDMRRSMVIDTPAMGSVSTSFVCLNCPLSIFGRDFGIDLVCLPLEQLDVILGMNWLEFNRVYINCFDKTVIFREISVKEDLFLSAKQVGESVQDGAELFMLLATLDVHERRTIEELPIVCDFAEVFPEDVSDLPPEREVEFSIDLVPGTSPVSMAPYRMSAFELKELKSQLEDLLEKKFIRPSVSP